MICQIACRSGLPPSVIEDTWSPAELRQAEALARLEGWGQEKRRTAAILAEMHNVSRIEMWARSTEQTRLPEFLNEGHFLPSRQVKRKPVDPAKAEAKREADMQNLTSVMNAMCGYR